MARHVDHSMLPMANHDEGARECFVVSLKSHISRTITPGNKIAMEHVVMPAFRRATNRDPLTLSELRRAMNGDPYHQTWGSLMRAAQELMWDAVEDPVDRQIDQLAAKSAKRKRTLGGLRIDKAFAVPNYLTAVDVHTMPGGYNTEQTENDMRQGAVYDRGVFLYHHGQRGTDDNGRLIVSFVNGEYPNLHPGRILELGCSVGNATTAFVDFFPGAEVHAIDLGAPMVRYAHARAEAMGKRIFFAQANAEETDYNDDSFDLVVSSNMLHETSRKALPRIMRECRRVLRPGGVLIHMEVPVRYGDLSLYDQVMRGWQTRNNCEPFWDKVCSMDLVAAAKAAGFGNARDGYVRRTLDPKHPTRLTSEPNQDNHHRYVLTAVK